MNLENCKPLTLEELEKAKNEINVDPRFWMLLKDLRNVKGEVLDICKKNKIPYAPYGLLLGQLNNKDCREEINAIMKILKNMSKKKMNDINGLNEICHIISEYIN